MICDKFKIVTYEEALKLKKLGFDEVCDMAYCNTNDAVELKSMYEEWEQHPMNNSDIESYLFDVREEGNDCTAPSYIEVWMWLWRNKKIFFSPCRNSIDIEESQDGMWMYAKEVAELDSIDDTEEAIIIAIRYLLNNDLIK